MSGIDWFMVCICVLAGVGTIAVVTGVAMFLTMFGDNSAVCEFEEQCCNG